MATREEWRRVWEEEYLSDLRKYVQAFVKVLRQQQPATTNVSLSRT